MGRAINMENRQDEFEHRLKLVEGAIEELTRELINATKTRHIELTKDVKSTKTVKDKAKKETIATT